MKTLVLFFALMIGLLGRMAQTLKDALFGGKLKTDHRNGSKKR